jgi:hypothetical protein
MHITAFFPHLTGFHLDEIHRCGEQLTLTATAGSPLRRSAKPPLALCAIAAHTASTATTSDRSPISP